MKNLLAIIALAMVPALGKAQSLKVKSDDVKVAFVADMQSTEGTVSGFEADINFDVTDLASSSISGKIPVSTLNTGNSRRDDHLKSSDYFDAEKYPNMTFKSTSITKKGDKYIMKGKLKIKDVERDETITFTFGDKVFKGNFTIQAAHYDLGNFAKKDPEETNVKVSFVVPVS